MKSLLCILLFVPQLALAAADIISVSGASGFIDSTDTAPAEIFGGTGGSNCSADAENNYQTCNSCQENTLGVCNIARIYTDLKLKIVFIDEEKDGYTLAVATGTTDNSLNVIESETTDNVAKGNNHEVVISWSTLCQDLNSDSGCLASFSKKIRVGVAESASSSEFSGTYQEVNIRLVVPQDAQATTPDCDTSTRGICGFTAYPGDKKIYVEDVRSEDENFPSDSNVKFKYFRVIYSTESFNSDVLNPREAMDLGNFKNIDILEGDSNTDPDLDDNQVDGLDNNTLYFFRGMVVDEANNLMDITADSVYTGNSDCPADVNATPTEEQEFFCPLIARPDAVVGLLKEDLNCFISTVAFGSSMHPMVKDFRKFRHRVLLSNKLGWAVNRAYYKYGAIASQYVAKSDSLKFIARGLLYPLWLFAKASVRWGFIATSLFSLGFLLSLVFILKKIFSGISRQHLASWLVLIALLGVQDLKAEEDVEVVQPKKRNSMPSSKYDNPTTKRVRIPHPNAKKGLTRITSDKDYIYKTIESPINHRMAVKFGIYDPIELSSEDGKTEFAEIYDSSESPMILIDYEWKWKRFLGEINWQLSTGVYFTQGNGVFENNPTRPAREQFTFVAIPLTANLIFKFKYWENQWVIPYFGGGVGAMGFSEIRDDSGPKFGGALLAPVFGGMALSLNSLSPKSAQILDNEYGVNRTLLAVEYRYLVGAGNYDFTGEIINAGFMVTY